MSIVRFLSKDGSRFQKEVAEPLPSKIELDDAAVVSEEQVAAIARAMFDHAHSREATIKGEGNVQRALDIMWTRTKLQERDYCVAQTRQILSLQQTPKREFMLYKARNGGMAYLEQGICFNDLTSADTIGVPIKPADLVMGKRLEEDALGNDQLDGNKLLKTIQRNLDRELKEQQDNKTRKLEEARRKAHDKCAAVVAALDKHAHIRHDMPLLGPTGPFSKKFNEIFNAAAAVLPLDQNAVVPVQDEGGVTLREKPFTVWDNTCKVNPDYAHFEPCKCVK